MEIARSNGISIRLHFDPKSLLRQIVARLVGEFRGAPEYRPVRGAQLLTLPSYEPRLVHGAVSAGRSSGYAPRWG